MASGSPPARNSGRPPNAALDAAILTAAQHHLGEHGYTRMSLQGVAAAAGTSVPALRRRYRSKPELAAASIDAMPTQPLPANTAHPRADALAILNNLRFTLTQHNGLAVLATLITERTRHPELLTHFRKRIDEPRHERLRQALTHGRQAGQIPDSLDPDTAASILAGSLYACYLKNQHIPEDWPERTLRIIWPPHHTAPYVREHASAQLAALTPIPSQAAAPALPAGLGRPSPAWPV